MFSILYLTNTFITKETRKPRTPSMRIPTAETFATFVNSSFVGFFSASQTRLHLITKDFIPVNGFMFLIENKGF